MILKHVVMILYISPILIGGAPIGMEHYRISPSFNPRKNYVMSIKSHKYYFYFQKCLSLQIYVDFFKKIKIVFHTEIEPRHKIHLTHQY